MIGKIRTFFALPNAHKWILLKISVLVPLVEVCIKTLKFKRTLAILKFFLNECPQPPENELQLIGRYRIYLYLYHRKLPFLGKCLARSLTLWFLLKRAGIETELKFGMKKKNKKLLAHSWLEYKGKALITRSEIDEGYIPFSESIVT